MTENAFSAKRVGKLVLLLIASIFLPAVCGLMHNARIDHLIVWTFICLVCFLCFALYLERQRLQGELTRGISNDYSLLTFIYLICLAAASLGSFLPALSAPVMASNLHWRSQSVHPTHLDWSMTACLRLERSPVMAPVGQLGRQSPSPSQ